MYNRVYGHSRFFQNACINARNLVEKTFPLNIRRLSYMNNNIHIAIDGPAGAGKSTIAKIIAEKLDIIYIDTGAMYRALTWKVLSDSIAINNVASIIETVNNVHIELFQGKVYIDGTNVTEEIRLPIVSNNVSTIAKIPEVRVRLVEIQRGIAAERSLVMDGRDIGTYVLPKANFKFYLTATIEERANRRYIELNRKGISTNIEILKEEIRQRDKIDTDRSVSPLRPAKDAIIIDTTSKSILELTEEIISYIKGGE